MVTAGGGDDGGGGGGGDGDDVIGSGLGRMLECPREQVLKTTCIAIYILQGGKETKCPGSPRRGKFLRK
jgi:hypothetical protein